MRALIADDYPEIRSALRVVLEQSGYEVLEAKDGREALEVFEGCMQAEQDIDLAVIDHMMPHFKGDVVVVGIRDKAKLHGRKPPKMVMLTGSKDGDLVARAQAAGLSQLFIKPDGIVALREWLTGRPAVA